MGSYRSRLDIIADILRVVSQNAKKTQIMYKANLSYNVLQRYLRSVTEASLVEFKAAERWYVLTSKGQEFLEAYREYADTNEHVDRKLLEIRGKKKALEQLCSSR